MLPVKTREADPFAVAAERGELEDDPFARAAAAPGGEPSGATAVERSVTALGPLAERDPHAPPDESAEYHVTGAISFDDLLRRARRGGFLAGCAAGALAAGVVAAALAWATSARPPPAPPPRPVEDAWRLPPPPPDQRGVRGPTARGSPTGADRARESGKGKARAPAAAADRTLAVPGLVLRPLDVDAPPPAAPVRRLDPADVVAALQGRREAIEGCVAAHPAVAAAAGGRRFHLVVTVEQTGAMGGASIDDAEIGATELGRCLLAVVRDVAVAPFDGEPVKVELPLRVAGGE